MLATSALAAARQAVDTSVERFEQAGAYRTLHPFLFRQALRHVSDNEAMVNVRDHLHCQLQVGGRPSSLDPSSSNSPPPDLTDILARFDDAPMRDVHNKPFFQDGGDDEAMVDIRDRLHCQLQAGGRPSSPTPSSMDSPPPDLTDILARFGDTPMRDVHAEPFFQDGGDDDGY